MKNIVIGIDISKKTLDWCVMNGREVAGYHKTGNDADSIVNKFSEVFRNGGIDVTDVLVCAEYTGRYIYPLVVACHKCGIALWLESGYNIHCESRKKRGKDDRVDAFRIAAYGRKNQDDARIYSMPAESIATLRDLLTERSLYNTQRAAYKSQIKDMRGYMPQKAYSAKVARMKKVMEELDRQIEAVERSMESLIDSDRELRTQSELLRTIPGIGSICAAALIAVTAGFTLFDNGRELCCFAGLAPFAYTSGTSIRSRRRVSGRADHDLKSLMHLCALTAATRRKDSPFAQYYRRKVADGKNKMSVLNAVRAKLMLTAFAVVRDRQGFEENHKINLLESEE